MGARPLKLSAQALAVLLVAGLFSLLVWKLVQSGGSNVAEELERGNRPAAPGFAFRRLDRPGSLSLASLRGKAVILNFWASWCVPCKQEAPLLEETWRRWAGRDVVIVGVDVGDLNTDARKFMRRYGVSYPVVYDGKRTTYEPYGLLGLPETFFVSRTGKVVAGIRGRIDRSEVGELERNLRLALAS